MLYRCDVLADEYKTGLWKMTVNKRGVTHRQRVTAQRLIIQFVFTQIQRVQVWHAREILWGDDSDVVLFKDKSHSKIYDVVHVVVVYDIASHIQFSHRSCHVD